MGQTYRDHIFNAGDIKGTDRNTMLDETIVDPDLTDEQRVRVWLQIERLTHELGRKFFEVTLPAVFALDSPITIRAIIDAREQLTDVFGRGESGKYDLARLLLRSLVAAPRLETKNYIANWLADVSNANILRELDRLDGVGLDDTEILAQLYPRAKRLQKWQDRLRGK